MQISLQGRPCPFIPTTNSGDQKEGTRGGRENDKEKITTDPHNFPFFFLTINGRHTLVEGWERNEKERNKQHWTRYINVQGREERKGWNTTDKSLEMSEYGDELEESMHQNSSKWATYIISIFDCSSQGRQTKGQQRLFPFILPSLLTLRNSNNHFAQQEWAKERGRSREREGRGEEEERKEVLELYP